MAIAEKNIDDVVSEYVRLFPVYKSLANKVESIVREVLNSSGASYYTISSRVKEIDSFSKKARKEKYKNPIKDIKDLAGIRVITFVKSEVNQVCNILKPLFDIDHLHSVDKTKELGNDRVGYRSVHYVAQLTEERLRLPEYQIYKGMSFEIQVRTILEHAWADISHDRNYKFSGVLPPENDIQRRFSLASATLELVDREFDNLAKEINQYDSIVKTKVESDDFNIEINTTSLRNYLSLKFKIYIEKGLIEASFQKASNKIIEELSRYGIRTLAELDKELSDGIEKYIYAKTNFIGLLRDIMIINNIENYFSLAWENSWSAIDIESVQYFRRLKIPIDSYIKKYRLDVDTTKD
ncbi:MULTISPECIES: GTP pyrophosphokinase family protein [unclassified Paenibacillus]|uniref:GTP pyrophosphokinase n=1 Tax=unclassified Paenibacillus TaxID=185978 RepID=UPI001E3A62FF|nr:MULTISPECIES: hypothetical protein [unclassified Paenibacillus]CAH0122585.1 hypothetical protein PAE9249_05157 [Paenibacillus sp. CECT 9249]